MGIRKNVLSALGLSLFLFTSFGCNKTSSSASVEAFKALAAKYSYTDSSSDSDKKVLLCHVPPGNPENSKIISVSIHALDAHLRHGDSDSNQVDYLIKDCSKGKKDIGKSCESTEKKKCEDLSRRDDLQDDRTSNTDLLSPTTAQTQLRHSNHGKGGSYTSYSYDDVDEGDEDHDGKKDECILAPVPPPTSPTAPAENL